MYVIRNIKGIRLLNKILTSTFGGLVGKSSVLNVWVPYPHDCVVLLDLEHL